MFVDGDDVTGEGHVVCAEARAADRRPHVTGRRRLDVDMKKRGRRFSLQNTKISFKCTPCFCLSISVSVSVSVSVSLSLFGGDGLGGNDTKLLTKGTAGWPLFLNTQSSCSKAMGEGKRLVAVKGANEEISGSNEASHSDDPDDEALTGTDPENCRGWHDV